MRILVTGVSGLDRKRAWVNIHNASIFDLGEEMLALAAERHMDLDEDTILHAGQDTLAALRAAAIAHINLSVAENPSDGAVIISTHSVFARVDGLAEGLLPADIKEIKPNLWVTLIDGPQAIEDELRTHTAEYFHLDLWDIVKWQELEVFFSHHLATENTIRHLVVPVSQPEVLGALARGDKRKTAYASYPMSHAPAETQKRIASFVQRIKEYFIVFDPRSIEASHGTKEHHTEKDRKAIGSHTIVRDLDWFIRINAEIVVAYWPDEIFSSGMSDELRFAYEIGRKTILVTERKEEGGLPLLSPFLTYKASVFWSSEEFFAFLKLEPNEQHLYTLFRL